MKSLISKGRNKVAVGSCPVWGVQWERICSSWYLSHQRGSAPPPEGHDQHRGLRAGASSWYLIHQRNIFAAPVFFLSVVPCIWFRVHWISRVETANQRTYPCLLGLYPKNQSNRSLVSIDGSEPVLLNRWTGLGTCTFVPVSRKVFAMSGSFELRWGSLKCEYCMTIRK